MKGRVWYSIPWSYRLCNTREFALVVKSVLAFNTALSAPLCLLLHVVFKSDCLVLIADTHHRSPTVTGVVYTGIRIWQLVERANLEWPNVHHVIYANGQKRAAKPGVRVH